MIPRYGYLFLHILYYNLKVRLVRRQTRKVFHIRVK
jgi:hypothetical protein